MHILTNGIEVGDLTPVGCQSTVSIGGWHITPGVREAIRLCVGDLGLGVFAKRLIRVGEVILEFGGLLVGFSEAVAKGDRECYPLQIGPGRYIDLLAPGCFANHSCNPNAGVRDLKLVAIDDILPGTEIRYDYSTTMDEDHFTMECRCKSANCRGIVTDFKYLDLATRDRYLRLGIVQPFIAQQHDPTRREHQLLAACRSR